MKRTLYQTSELARRACVSARTLRYYDQVGLLTPSFRSEAGYRLYTEDDLVRLQQILGLKYLGFSLDAIARCLRHGPSQLLEALAVQRAMISERKAHLELILEAIDTAQAAFAQGNEDWTTITKIMEVMQMSEQQDWAKKYFSEEQLEQMRQLSESSYTEEDQAKLAEWGKDFSEADQQAVTRQWDEVYAEVRRLADAGADPAGTEAQAVIARYNGLISAFTRDDPGISAGLEKFWAQVKAMPAPQAPLPKVLTEAQETWLRQAQAADRQA